MPCRKVSQHGLIKDTIWVVNFVENEEIMRTLYSGSESNYKLVWWFLPFGTSFANDDDGLPTTTLPDRGDLIGHVTLL